MVGTVWQAALQADPLTVMCVVSDHGFARYDQDRAHHSALRDAGSCELDPQGKLKSWRAIQWGSGAVMLNNPNDDEARTTTRAVWQKWRRSRKRHREDHRRNRRAKNGRVSRRGVRRLRQAWLHGRAAAFKVRSFNRPRWAALTGYGASCPIWMRAFSSAGQGIPNGRVANRINMRDIAPTLAGPARRVVAGGRRHKPVQVNPTGSVVY